VWLADKDMV